MTNFDELLMDDTASIASSTIQSFIQTTDKANYTSLPHSLSYTQTTADLHELPVVNSCNDLILSVDRPPSPSSSELDENIFRI